MAKVFISYRRTDSAGTSGRIYDRLIGRFGKENIFKDVDDIPVGVRFPDYIQDSLRQCVVELVIIGREWLIAKGEDGGRRLDDPRDWVRLEIELGFAQGLAVIPVLVDGAGMPTRTSLPESLQVLREINAVEVRNDPDFGRDMERLMVAIERAIAVQPQRSGPNWSRRPRPATPAARPAAQSTPEVAAASGHIAPEQGPTVPKATVIPSASQEPLESRAPKPTSAPLEVGEVETTGGGQAPPWRPSRPLIATIGTLLVVTLLGALLATHVPGLTHAGAGTPSASRSLASRPSRPVAYARITVVRVLVYYNGTLKNDSTPIPVLSPCTADGALVGTTGANLNSFDYVLTPTSAVNPIKPCAGVQAAFQQLNGAASSWSISHIDVMLNAAYTGTGSNQLGSIVYNIYPAEVVANAGPTAPPLLALPLSAPPGAPNHDLPVLSTPEPSDPTADPSAATVLDITNINGQPLGHDTETVDEVKSVVYPITVASPSAVAGTPLPLSSQLSLGAPEIDSNGRLIGMVISNSQGYHVLSSLSAVNQGIGPVTGKSGTLMTQWQQGLASYYATPPQYSQAASIFQTLVSTYPDFGGAKPFLTAAQVKTTTIPELT